MEKKVTAGSPISQNEENVKAFFRKIFDFGNSSPISQNDEKVKNFIEENAAKIMEVYDYEWRDEEI